MEIKNKKKPKGMFVWIIFVAVLVLLGINHISNETFIKNYNKSIYKENIFWGMGFWEPYVAPYNEGNLHYQQGNYEEAKKCYQLALEKSPDKNKTCEIRVNLALSMVVPLEIRDDKKNAEEILPVLEEAAGILTEKDCANGQGTGHHKEAQQLLDEILDLMDRLEQEENPEEEEKKEEEKEEEKETDEEEKNKRKKQLLESQQQGTKERYQNMEESRMLGTYEYYDGKTW